MNIKKIAMFLLLAPVSLLSGQELQPEVLGFEEYLAYVKKYHPVARQAQLRISQGEAQLLKARGGFDPKLEVDYARKQFKDTEYYGLLNSTFKLPTWYGLEFKAGYEQNQGQYLNPQQTVPEEGLFSAGISLAVGKDMLMDKRMAALRTARIFQEQSAAERDLLVNEVLYQAALAYFDWYRAYNEARIYEDFVENAQDRFRGISRSASTGEIPAIDTVEAKIALQDRLLQLEQVQVNLVKQRLELSNFLWLQGSVPVELQEHMQPEQGLLEEVNEVLGLLEQELSSGRMAEDQQAEDSEDLWEPAEISPFAAGKDAFEDGNRAEDNPLLNSPDLMENHPKIRALRAKREAQGIARSLKANNLLPDIDLEYNFITTQPDHLAGFDPNNYKAGLRLSVPLFLRKERAELRLADLKLQDTQFEIQLNQRQLHNKIEAVLGELDSYRAQQAMLEEMVANYRTMLAAEERKFSFGESSLFLVNSRETKLIEAYLKQNEVITKFLHAKARLFQNIGRGL